MWYVAYRWPSGNTASLPSRSAYVGGGQEIAGENLGREGPDKAQGKDKGCHGLTSAPPSWGRFRQHRELTEKPGHCKGPSLITQEMGATSGSFVPMCLTDGPVV